MGDESDILIILGLGYLVYKTLAPPVKQAVKAVEPAYKHVTGEAHRELGITRVMGGSHGFKGTSTLWPRFFPPITEWFKLG